MKPDGMLPPVMIVDDSDDDALLASRCLKAAGLKNPLLHFRSGGDAFMFLKQFCPPATTQGKPPCLMLLDVNMDGLSGFDILLWARQQPQFKDLKIFMLSGANEEWDAQIAAKLGADEYLQKFPEPTVFAELLTNVLPSSVR